MTNPRSTTKQATRWDTQDLAWDSAKEGKQTIALMLLQTITDRPSTCDELEQLHRLSHQTCSAAVNWLMRHNLITSHTVRRTRSGRSARVWRKFVLGDTPIKTRRDTGKQALDLQLELTAAKDAIRKLTAERDIARRMYCRAMADLMNPYRTPEDIALDREWDCFQGEHQ